MAYTRTYKGRNDIISNIDAAKLLGISVNSLNYKRSIGLLPDGEKQSGRRYYYTAEQIKRIAKQLKENK